MSCTNNLILLEFFVEGIKFDNFKKLQIANFDKGKVCVLFKFLDFPPLQVNEDDRFHDGRFEHSFRSGRSGLFSLPDQSDLASDLLSIDVYVMLKLPGDSQDKVPIGKTKINMTQHVSSVILDAKLFPEKTPVTRSIRNSFTIGDNEDFVGIMSLFVRASCFGTRIIQDFNVPCRRTVSIEQHILESERNDTHIRNDKGGDGPSTNTTILW